MPLGVAHLFCMIMERVSLFILSLFFAVSCSQYQPTWDSLDKRPLPEWYDEAKIGIFLHWGVFSVPSFGGGDYAEWFWYNWKGSKKAPTVAFMEKNYPPDFTYPDFAPMFKAELFDPNKWAGLLQNSGAKYVVLTSKHLEGFTNWPSKASWNWNSVDTGPHRDLVNDLAAAIRNNTDIYFGLYYCMFELLNPIYIQEKADGFSTQVYPKEVTLPQMVEIVNAYKPDIIWSDGEWEAPDTYWNSTEFLAWVYNESPVKDHVIVNDRWGKGSRCTHGGFFNCGDHYNPRTLQKHKWENAFSMDKTSWGYRRDAVLSDYYTIEEILEEVVSTVSCGGNALINIGPTHDGRIVPVFEKRLAQLGAWLKINGEAIYSSKPWTHQNDSSTGNVWYTTSYNAVHVYAIALEWPDNNILKLGSVKASSGSTATILGYGKVNFETSSNGVVQVSFPNLPLDTPLMWAWVIRFDGVSSY